MTSLGQAPNLSVEVSLVNLDKVLPTEEVNPDFVATLSAGMAISGFWTHPLLLEANSLAVLDGHHRLAAAKRIGLCSIPAVCVSYADPQVHLESWRHGTHFTPDEILWRARAGNLLPYKSTRHITDFVRGVPRLHSEVTQNIRREIESALARRDRADAIRALEKLELLAQKWSKARHISI